jgi:hypothetical protein
MKTKVHTSKLLCQCLALMLCASLKGQNILSVPFNNGFIGNNTANNACSNSVYLSSLGWSNIQFSQNSSATTFVSQGNDIIGFVLITDHNGVEHSIPGFIKWRAPNNPVTSLVFAPSAGSSITLATNGSNGSASYTISSSKYIGLIFNNQTLNIPANGTVSGNAATQGLLDQLNTYLGSFPYLTTPNYTINESAGTVTVTLTLSAASSSTITVMYTTSNVTALSSTDYTSKSGSLSFSPGQLSKTVVFAITTDAIAEATETFSVIFSDAVNASIQDGISTITILDNAPLAAELVSFNVGCNNGVVNFSWSTASEQNSDYFLLVRLSGNGSLEQVAQVESQGNSNELTEYSYASITEREGGVYQLIEFDMDGSSTSYQPVSVQCRSTEEMIYEVYPNPSKGELSLKIDWKRGKETAHVTIHSIQGGVVYDNLLTIMPGVNVHFLNLSNLNPGTYILQAELDSKVVNQRIILE